MSTTTAPQPVRSCTKPRVWLVAGVGSTPEPTDHPTVRDNCMRTWYPGPDGRYHCTAGWHQSTWTDLHTRYDLVEVLTAA